MQLTLLGFGVPRGDSVIGGRIYQELPGSSLAGEPCGNVGDVAQRGEVFEASAADVAHELLAARDPDTDIEPIDRSQKAHAPIDCPPSIVASGETWYEHTHHEIALDLTKQRFR